MSSRPSLALEQRIPSHAYEQCRQAQLAYKQAEALDIRLPGLEFSAVRNAALLLHRGGVLYYAKSDLIHVDVGRVRRW